MPLSEHEQRLLDQIERALYDEDPKFASTVRTTDLRSHTSRQVRRASLLFAAGVALLLAGVVTSLVVVGVVGAGLMFVAMLLGLSAVRRGSGRVDLRSAGQRTRAPRSSRSSMVERAEERWRRRGEERGQ